MPVFRLMMFMLIGSSAAVVAGQQNTFKLSLEEQNVLDLTNAARSKEMLPPLKPNPVLFAVARAHAANMAKQGKMEHVLDGKTPYDRIKAAGYKYVVAGENIARGDLTLAEIFAAWMNSKRHHENIVDQEFTEIGIGLCSDGKGDVYYTQVFALPRK